MKTQENFEREMIKQWQNSFSMLRGRNKIEEKKLFSIRKEKLHRLCNFDRRRYLEKFHRPSDSLNADETQNRIR